MTSDDMESRSNPQIDISRLSLLIDLAKENDDEAFSAICGKIQPYLERMAIKKLDPALRQKLNPSDIAQQTITRMLQGFKASRIFVDPHHQSFMAG
jgi:hypothetical protein